ncbi:MAG: lysophospholipid acyltransferase family protein [Alphaproteobacteria bacterium]|jgi:1-acyl-sn-glycerol-3-phosphate acyltransferase|nr:lysophospholipid acyltransferase family protein [Alphaproteobacteria bacterium]
MKGCIRQAAGRAVALGVIGLARTLTGIRATGRQPSGPAGARVYFANHGSHADFVLLWTGLPPALRRRTRPVAASDYWRLGVLRRFIAEAVFDAVLIERNPENRTKDPVELMCRSLDQGRSLILFPEGRRNEDEARLLPFRTGLYHLAAARPETQLVPVWLDNAKRVLPRGKTVPVPLACTARFGRPLHLAEDEAKEAFLVRARSALISLATGEEEGRQ